MEKIYKNALLSAEEMYEADRMTMQSGPNGPTLMENAGACVAREIMKRFSPRKTVILCGPGNNGGDGFVLARRLHQRGWFVRVLLLGKRENLKGDAAYHSAKWPFDVYPFDLHHIRDAALIVDGVFGAGLSRPVEGRLKTFLDDVQRLNTPIVSIDIPSGIDANTGQVRGFALKSDLTVTFARFKRGHFLYPARAYCGELCLGDIGIKDQVIETLKPQTFQNHPDLWVDQINPLSWETHKFKRGHGVIVAGSMTGASRLAAQNARRMGCGLLTLQSQGTASLIYRQTEAGVIVSTDLLETHLCDHRKNAYLIGPGLGTSQVNQQNVQTLWQSDRSLVIDADGLNCLAMIKSDIAPKRSADTILTPHEGEFQRLFGDLEGSKIDKAIQAANRMNAILIYKGADTIIAAPDGKVIINHNAPPSLATAGSGDCLAGMCLGLLAQNMSAFEAAAMAVWCHGEAAQLCANNLLAEDISHHIGAVLKKVQTQFIDQVQP